MGNKRKVIHIICAIFIFILTSFTFFLTGENLNSLIKMDEKITFSGRVVIIFFSSPLIFYYMIAVIFVNITGRSPKHHDGFVNCFGTIAITSFFLSFPISLYVHYKLKSDDYLVCPRISLMVPNTYVKDMKLCD
ncbi:DUF1240 domain-containing protein [Photorhabdus sp. RW14-46]|uniref:DUF1240 domain-containing protein n=1 Tax=Photorhabdus sp. RW14-46 TaxID=2100168 RepID=UPI0013F3E2E8|nr:DUF1240 domain-containing protein [Photorhabdus sp. RW14-46]NHB62668.1 hypothetical protein [Photorhabdus sp. RW14-46]